MKPFYAAIIALMLTAQGAFAQTELPEAFTDGLKRAKMVFEMPKEFYPVAIVNNPHARYDYAIKHDTADIEIRYFIFPLDELIQRYEESLKDTTGRIMRIDPDQVSFFVTMSTVIGLNISKHPSPRNVTIGDELVKRIYNADNGMIFFTNPRDEFGKGYKYCSMYSVYKQGLGTACYFFLGNDQYKIVDTAAKLTGSLKFEETQEE